MREAGSRCPHPRRLTEAVVVMAQKAAYTHGEWSHMKRPTLEFGGFASRHCTINSSPSNEPAKQICGNIQNQGSFQFRRDRSHFLRLVDPAPARVGCMRCACATSRDVGFQASRLSGPARQSMRVCVHVHVCDSFQLVLFDLFLSTLALCLPFATLREHGFVHI